MSPWRNPLLQAIRQPLRHWVLSAFPSDPAQAIDYDRPIGDPGLFGPSSITWRVHADFCGMLAGGLCALMLQALHPRVLAGVWDHSDFRSDLVGRLRRTTAFVGGTTYAPRAEAEAMIDKVRRIHARVRGVDEDGHPYAADDPDLLAWVHVTEAYSFLQGYRRYGRKRLPQAAVDRYFEETRRVAEALGARGVPASAAAVQAYFARMRASLRYGQRSRAVLDVLERIRLPVPMPGLSRDLFMHAGAALLPGWAEELMERTPGQRRRGRIAAMTLGVLAPAFRVALAEGVATRSCRRVGVPPELLRDWP